ncbi:hypothetical protein SDC9_153204 [bioreactor metagenome]|uniref:Catalase n=1 Tax=bioreactor metagenome TaxID=1076179 RepID=A0A645EWY0_9ZZZZ
MWNIVGDQQIERGQRNYFPFVRHCNGDPDGQRHFDMELAADTQFAFHPNPPMHDFDQLAGNGRTQPRSPETTAHRGIGLGKRIENPGDAVRGYANAGIADNQVNHVAKMANTDPDLAAVREFDGITEQIEENLLDAQGVALEEFRFAIRVIQNEREALGLGVDPKRGDDLHAHVT